MDEFDKQHVEVMGYLHAISSEIEVNRLCKFFKSDYEGAKGYCEDCVFEIKGALPGHKCWLSEIKEQANEKLNTIKAKNMLKVGKEYKRRVINYGN